jgi:hypothetical protein
LSALALPALALLPPLALPPSLLSLPPVASGLLSEGAALIAVAHAQPGNVKNANNARRTRASELEEDMSTSVTEIEQS